MEDRASSGRAIFHRALADAVSHSHALAFVAPFLPVRAREVTYVSSSVVRRNNTHMISMTHICPRDLTLSLFPSTTLDDVAARNDAEPNVTSQLATRS